MTRKIPLFGKIGEGKFTLIDSVDFSFCMKYKWYISSAGYVVRSEKRRLVLMHREILNAPSGKMVDHINHNTLDNRRENIRIVSGTENQFNRGIQKNNTSGYKGIFKTREMWMAFIQVAGRKFYSKRFIDIKDAVLARKNLEEKYV